MWLCFKPGPSCPQVTLSNASVLSGLNVLVEVQFICWIAIYPLDRVIYSLNNGARAWWIHDRGIFLSVVQAFSETEGNGLAPTSLLKLSGRASEAHRFNSCRENSDFLFPSINLCHWQKKIPLWKVALFSRERVFLAWTDFRVVFDCVHESHIFSSGCVIPKP